MTDLVAARRFVAPSGRLLDRRRLAHHLDDGPAEAVEAAVAAYANPDGGYAGVIEPDVRTLVSQRIAALTAFDVLADVGASSVPSAALRWLASTANDGGGIPFHLPATDGAPQAPCMQPSRASSLHMTAAVTAAALRLGAGGPWVDGASRYCTTVIDAGAELTAYETKYVIAFLDASGDDARLEALTSRMPRDGRLPVEGGTDGETLRVLDLAPRPGRAARRLFDEAAVQAELDAPAHGQRDDGGWDFDWQHGRPPSPTSGALG